MKSIRQRLTLAIVGGFGALLLVGGLTVYFFARVALLEEFDAGLRAKALVIISRTDLKNSNLHLDLPDEGQGGDIMPQFFELWQLGGTNIIRSDSLQGTDLAQAAGSQAQPAYWDVIFPGGIARRAVGFTFLPDVDEEDSKGQPPIQAALTVAADRGPLDKTLALLAGILVATGLLTLAATVPVVRFSLRRGLAPLEQLSRQANAITAESLEARFPVATMPEELRSITARLNDLLGRLEDSFERERRFSADLAHELRTPIAELRNHAEVELEWSDGGEPGRHRDTLEIALQMEALVTSLLQLSRCENGNLSVQRESIKIKSFVEEIWRSVEAAALKKNLAITLNIPGDAAIEADPALFRSIIGNLFANAVEYSPANGRVEINWLPDVRELAVSNAVYNLTADDLPHIFERLWRKDKSRTDGKHSGLGLSLARSFASLLGFELIAQFSGPATVVFRLRAAGPPKGQSRHESQTTIL